MSRRIFKYTLDFPHAYVSMPSGYEVIHVDTQINEYGNHITCLWAIVDTNAPLVRKKFVHEPTGTFLGDGQTKRNYIGTVTHGNLVWHIFGVDVHDQL